MLQTVPPTLLQATSDPHLQQRLLDTHRQVSCGVTAPSYGSWCTRFCCALQESISQSCVSSASSMAGLMANSSKRTYAIPTPRSPFPVAEHCQPIPPQEMLKHSSVSVSVGTLGPGPHKVHLSPLSISGGNGVWFWTWIRLFYHLAGAAPLPLDIGYLLTAAPVCTVLLGFLWPWMWGISSWLLLLTLDVVLYA